MSRRRRTAGLAVGAGLTLAVLAFIAFDRPAVPDFADWPVDARGYAIEPLGVCLSASFARGSEVYLGLCGSSDGAIVRVDDRDLARPWLDMKSPLAHGPRMLFASRHGFVFASPNGEPTYRTTDGGKTWRICLDVPTWRMDEDDLGHLYAGNYTKNERDTATLYKSTDGGDTWQAAFKVPDTHHFHTVRWDDRAGRLYVAYGDGRERGEAYSDDRGRTFHVLGRGSGHGHTDAAVGDDYVFWASDDQSGRVYRVRRGDGARETLMGGSQFIWFAVAEGRQVYVGTMTSNRRGGERAALLASHDQGATWRKLLATAPSAGPYDKGFIAESRRLSADGWLYVSDGDQGYRVRRRPPATQPES